MTSDHFVLQKNHSTLQYTIHVISDCVIMSPPFYFLYWIVDICSKMGPLNLSWAAPLLPQRNICGRDVHIFIIILFIHHSRDIHSPIWANTLVKKWGHFYRLKVTVSRQCSAGPKHIPPWNISAEHNPTIIMLHFAIWCCCLADCPFNIFAGVSA